MKKGKFIVLEGTDGCGKATQLRLLKKNLIKAGYTVATFDFPQYSQESSYFVKQYLTGKYGTIDEVGPYKASIFYALDRFSAHKKIKEAINRGHIALSNRYIGSNMSHQGSKLKTKSERKRYFQWLYDLEFGILDIPKADLSVILHVSAKVAQKLVDKKDPRKYTEKTRDLHEGDLTHLKKAEKVYLELAEIFPKRFRVVECMRGDALLSPGEVQEKLWKKIKVILAKHPLL